MSFTVSLCLPNERKGVEEWIIAQSSETIADIFEYSKLFFETVSNYKEQKKFNDILYEKDKEIKQIKDEKCCLVEKLETDFEKRYQTIVNDQKTQISVLNNQFMILNNQISCLQEEKRDYSLQNQKLHEEKLQLTKQCTEKIEKLTKSLTGTSASIGAVGEGFVKHKMTSMNLGTYDDDSQNRNVGFADGTWKYQYELPNIPPISCLVEVKNKRKLEKSADFDKFEKVDVPAAHNGGRINMAIFISLLERISGRNWISLDTKLGVPTLYISRNDEDAISAEALVEIAFRTMSQIWPTISQQSDKDIEVTMNEVGMHIESQLVELEALFKHVADLEKQGNSLIKKASAMKRVAETMESNMHRLRMSDSRLVINANHQTYDFWSNEGKILIDSLRQYNREKKRHATRLEDLKDLDENVTKKTIGIPNGFQTALNTVKAEIQREAGVKRQQAKLFGDNKRQKNNFDGEVA